MSTATARAVFSPVNNGGRVNAVAQRLTDAIRLGIIADGERFPRETTLAEQFGVSPATLRDALAVLRKLGLVETRRGRGGGTFVRAPALVSDAVFTVLSPQELRDLGDYRMAIAGAAARLATERALDHNFADLREHLQRLRAATSMTERQRADARFHVELAAAAQSPRLTRSEMDLWTQVGNLIWLPVPESDTAAIVEEHADILNALEARDAPLAQARAEAHVDAQTRRMLVFLQGVDVGR